MLTQDPSDERPTLLAARATKCGAPRSARARSRPRPTQSPPQPSFLRLEDSDAGLQRRTGTRASLRLTIPAITHSGQSPKHPAPPGRPLVSTCALASLARHLCCDGMRRDWSICKATCKATPSHCCRIRAATHYVVLPAHVDQCGTSCKRDVLARRYDRGKLQQNDTRLKE